MIELIIAVLAVLAAGVILAVIVSAPVLVILAIASMGSRATDARTGRVAAMTSTDAGRP